MALGRIITLGLGNPFAGRKYLPTLGFGTSGTSVTPTTKTGTGGIDPGEGLRRFPAKPTGLLDRPKKEVREGRKNVEDRIDESAQIAAEIAGNLAREFGDETQRQEAANIVEMSMAEVDFEIGVLLRKKIRNEEEEIMLMLLMIAVSV